MICVYIQHIMGADRVMQFPTQEAADAWISIQHDPKLFYTVDWS